MSSENVSKFLQKHGYLSAEDANEITEELRFGDNFFAIERIHKKIQQLNAGVIVVAEYVKNNNKNIIFFDIFDEEKNISVMIFIYPDRIHSHYISENNIYVKKSSSSNANFKQEVETALDVLFDDLDSPPTGEA